MTSHARPRLCRAPPHKSHRLPATSRWRSQSTTPAILRTGRTQGDAQAAVDAVRRERMRHCVVRNGSTALRRCSRDRKYSWRKPCTPRPDIRGNSTNVDRLHIYESPLWISCTPSCVPVDNLCVLGCGLGCFGNDGSSCSLSSNGYSSNGPNCGSSCIGLSAVPASVPVPVSAASPAEARCLPFQ